MTAPARFVLRYRGDGPAPAADVARIESVPGTVVVERSDRMLLVEAAGPDDLRAVVDGLAGWVVAPEQTYTIPDRPL
ncbi:MAG: hypothetical protein ACRD12_18615 [Acidimicrobiales bacterium]